MKDIDQLISKLKSIDGSSFLECKKEWIEKIKTEFPGMPERLIYFYEKLGYGGIGNSRYMIHAFLGPDEIYDQETCKGLQGIVIVGDDFAGNCEAYDARNGWAFGGIGSSGKFEIDDSQKDGFLSFLIDWFGDE